MTDVGNSLEVCICMKIDMIGTAVECRGEGGLDGGIVVQDCLDLMNNLLRGNPGNQLLFRSVLLIH